MNALRALDLMDLVQEFNHLTLLQIDSLSRAWTESVEALWAAYESNDPTQSQEAYDRMRTGINGVKGK